jgi:hypothetical protein
MRKTTLALIALLSVRLYAQIDTSTLRPVGYHPNAIAYYNAPYFSNALFEGGEWYSFTNNEFGTSVDFNALPSQFINGYPQFLNPGQKLRALIFGLNIQDPFRPAGWADREKLAKGRIVVTWQGNADVRLANATFVSSNGAETGLILNGRREYLCTGNQSTGSIEVHAINTPAITQMRVWLAPVDDPSTTGVNENLTGTLENQLFHPLLLQRIADRDWAFIRFMDWGATNASPQQDWSDRRSPSHIFMNGIITKREPSAGSDPNRETGVAYEYMVALCNATDKDLWINIPHMATTDYITKLAQLIRFGSDGTNPYTSVQANPLFAPLESNRRVFIEYSNEIWSSGFAFAQGNWAEEHSGGFGFPAGEEKARFNARKFCDTWSIFQNVFEGTTRLVRVAATFTALDSYTTPFLQEIGSYGPTRSPAVRPDVLAITTYFGNDIQGFVNDQGFTSGKLYDDPYWTSNLFQTHLTTAFDEWKRRILSGDSASGSGPDSTGVGGGFSSNLRTLPNTILGYSLPLIAYEGGPSIFTDDIDQGNSTTDDNVTTFMEAMNRDSRIADVYRIHLEIAKSKALWTHNPYTDTSLWSRFGQWGHLETLDAPTTSPKYSLMLEHFTRFSSVRHVDSPLGAVPQFVTDAILPAGIAGQVYSTDITTTGGNGTRTATVIGSYLDPGLVVSSPSAGTIRISGSPGQSRKNYIMVNVTDADGDPAWRIFTLETFGGPGTLVQSDFRGDDPALHLAWTPTYVLSPKITWSGWNIGAAQSGGAGVTPKAGDNAIVFSVSAPLANDETLTQAIADNEYLKATTTVVTGPLDLRGAQVRFSTKRIGFHSPRGYALFCSLSGFSEVNALYVSAQVDKGVMDETEHIVTLPSTAAFQTVNTAVEWRIYAYGAQFDGHETSLTAFKITEDTSGSPPATPAGLAATAQSSSQVLVTWNAVTNAAYYEVLRLGGGSETTVGSPGAPTFNDTTVAASTAYVYRVRAIGAGGTSSYSSKDLATTVIFTDDPVTQFTTPVRRTHLIELRTAVNAVRTTAGLGAQVFTDNVITAGSTSVRAVHITELRSALSAALSALAFTTPTYTNAVSAGVKIRAADIQEIRAAVK